MFWKKISHTCAIPYTTFLRNCRPFFKSNNCHHSATLHTWVNRKRQQDPDNLWSHANYHVAITQFWSRTARTIQELCEQTLSLVWSNGSLFGWISLFHGCWRKSLSRNVEKKWFKIMPDKINKDYTNLVTWSSRLKFWLFPLHVSFPVF